MANELFPDYDELTVRKSLDDLYQERWKGERHALWGEQLSQAMLKHLLHATTMNRDGDLASTDRSVDFAEFDTGADATPAETAGAGADTAATDGGPHADS
jgi:glycerol-3-phosphate dehydrogenase